MDEKLIQEIKVMVDSFFSEKEEAEVRRRTEEALQKSAETISELTVALEDKNSESEEVATKIADLEAKVAELQTGLEAAHEEKASADEKLTEAVNTIEEMKKDKAAEERMSVLEDAGVVGSIAEAQTAKIREMDEEEFAAYKDERIELRKAVIAELEASKQTAEEEIKDEEDIAAEEAAEEEASEEELVTPPANINTENVVKAALNLETTPSDDVKAKYAELGKAMASLMVGQKEE